MVTRTALIVSSLTNKGKKISTTAATLGELKAEEPSLFSGDVEIVVKPGNVTLRDDGSELPSGDFKVYVIPTKNKAGWDEDDVEEFLEEVSERVHNALGEKFGEVKASVLSVLDEYKTDNGCCDEGNEDVGGEEDDEIAQALREAKNM